MSFIFYRKNVKNKEALADAQGKIYHLKDIVDNYDEKEDSFKKVLFQHFDIFKKVALLESHLIEEEKKQGRRLLKKVNDIVYNENSLDWDMLYDTLNKLYKGFPDVLRAKYPDLDETEVKIYCLTYAGLINSEIAIILGFSVNTIQMKKSAIRKKLKIDGYGNIVDFFDKNIN
ncbi:helix-turn-helix transcriptional regulator [Dysgonomonas sp. Marseille-P4677]|nr:helix-turn-helix transcriptional regulator [Dysgonomonas sp. Marseille-P4677]